MSSTCSSYTTTVQRTGRVFIHKAKRNSNLSFSKGKTWYLEDVRVLEVMGVSVLLAYPHNNLIG